MIDGARQLDSLQGLALNPTTFTLGLSGKFCNPAVVERAFDRCYSPIQTRDRIRKFWGIEPEVIYPPVKISKYMCKPPEDYYRFISRLNLVKRANVVIEAFKNLSEKLIVVGTDEEELTKSITKKVRKKGRVS